MAAGAAGADRRPFGAVIAIGLIATALVIGAALAISSLFTPEDYGSWVAVIWMAAIPTQIIMALVWHFERPSFAARLPQPWKGIVFTLLTGLAAAIVGAALVYGPGQGVTPPAPMLVMYTILTIVVTLQWVIAWGCWPVSLLKNPLAIGLLLIPLAYLAAYGLFRALFSFEFMAGAPVYVAALDPKGVFMAWDAIAFAVTTVAALLFLVLFEFWPVRLLPGAGMQPLQGIYASILVGAIAYGVFYTFTGVLGWDKVDYLVRVPVAAIFGFFLVNNMMQGRILAGAAQPLKGLVGAALAIACAIAMGVLYRIAAPFVVGRELAAGAPAYELELWVANAMLAVTFPIIIAYSGGLEFWPFVRRTRSADHT